MTTETEKISPPVEVSDTKDIKEVETTLENKQQKQNSDNENTKKEECEKKETSGESNVASAKDVPVHKSDFEKDVVYLYQLPRSPLLPSVSPYCLKVETWLRLNGIKYENVDHKLKYRSKKGRLPFVELNGEEIADSTIILEELRQKFEKDLDATLTNEQKCVSHALIRMIENHLVWVITYWRTKNLDLVLKGYNLNLQQILGSRIPNGILNFFFKITLGRKGARKVKAHGIGEFNFDQVVNFGNEDLKALSDVLADKPFFFGDEPTMLDVVAFANLAQILYIHKDIRFPLRDFVQDKCPNLVGHCSRMKERCFTDWDEICTSLAMNTHLPKEQKSVNKENKEEAKESKESTEEKEGDKEKSDKEEKDIEKEKEIDGNKKDEK